MTTDTNCYEALQAYLEAVERDCSENQTKPPISEIESGVIRITLKQLGCPHKPTGRKLTAKDKERAFAYMSTLPISLLPRALTLLNEEAEELGLGQASFRTYTARVRKWLTWSEANGYWPECRYKSPEIQAQCGPKMQNIYGEMDDVHLTERRGVYAAYALTLEDAPPHIQQWRQKTFDFLVRIHQPGRVFDHITDTAADRYLTCIYRILGWYKNHEGIPADDLSVDLIFPRMGKAEFLSLSAVEQKERWREMQLEFETMLCDYRDFISAESPHTWKGVLSTIRAIGRVQYAGWVDADEEYENIPLFKTLKKYFRVVFQELEEWEEGGESVSDWSKKWPDTPEGMTALEVVQEKVLEPIRQECRPRNYLGYFHKPRKLAHKYQHFLKLALVGINPPRRSQDDRTTRIALSCPIQRPHDVPANGCFYPLPPNTIREKDRRRKVTDVYLYRTYRFRGRQYPDGVWVRDIQGYKTKKKHGRFQVILPNRKFQDGRYLYDYLEEYLEGLWLPGSFPSRRLYQGLKPELQGKMGRWITAGRSEFNPQDTEERDSDGCTWRWGYLFVGVKSGQMMTHCVYAKSIRSNSFRLIGKKMTPHTFRYIWATWAIQAGLSDAELRALAYMMGHSVDTLRRIYERCTPSEKQQIIEDAINRKLCNSLTDIDSDKVYTVEQLMHFVMKLSRQDVWAFFGQLYKSLLGKHFDGQGA
jgi:hypothetical protein